MIAAAAAGRLQRSLRSAFGLQQAARQRRGLLSAAPLRAGADDADHEAASATASWSSDGAASDAAAAQIRPPRFITTKSPRSSPQQPEDPPAPADDRWSDAPSDSFEDAAPASASQARSSVRRPVPSAAAPSPLRPTSRRQNLFLLPSDSPYPPAPHTVAQRRRVRRRPRRCASERRTTSSPPPAGPPRRPLRLCRSPGRSQSRRWR